MNHDELQAFVEFSDCLNFSKAADRLSISQPALHVKIANLSKKLEVPLYAKEGRRLFLTHQGQQLADYAREVLTREGDFLRTLSGGSGHSVVTMVAGAGAYLYLLGRGLSEFLSQGGARLRLLQGDRNETLLLLRQGKVDLGVTVLGEIPEHFRGVRLCTLPSKLVISKNHRLARRRMVRLADLEGESLILPPAHSPWRITVERALEQAEVPWTLGLEASGWPLMIQFASLGLGAALVNGCCHVPNSCRAIVVEGLEQTDYYILWLSYRPPEGEVDRLVRACREGVTRAISASSPWVRSR